MKIIGGFNQPHTEGQQAYIDAEPRALNPYGKYPLSVWWADGWDLQWRAAARRVKNKCPSSRCPHEKE